MATSKLPASWSNKNKSSGYPLMTDRKEETMSEGYQTHEDIEEIPEGVSIPDSSGSLEPDVEEPEPVDYSGVDDEGEK